MRNKDNITIHDFSEGALLALWSVAKNGYHITSGLEYLGQPAPGVDPPFIVPNDNLRKDYPILGNKLLHRNFAALDSNNDGDILKFANRYGLLGEPLILGQPTKRGALTLTSGESLPAWKLKIKTFGTLLAIWDLVKDKDAGKLGQIILWPHSDRVLVSAYWIKEGRKYKFYPGSKYRNLETFRSSCAPNNSECGVVQRILADKYQNPVLLQRWRQRDLVEPALFYICREINENLTKQFSFKILPFVDKEIYIMPYALESAMWLMFAYEVNGRTRPVQCANEKCGQWFQQDDARQKYCSNACRQKAWRLEKEKAKGAHHERVNKAKG